MTKTSGATEVKGETGGSGSASWITATRRSEGEKVRKVLQYCIFPFLQLKLDAIAVLLALLPASTPCKSVFHSIVEGGYRYQDVKVNVILPG